MRMMMINLHANHIYVGCIDLSVESKNELNYVGAPYIVASFLLSSDHIYMCDRDRHRR